MTSERYLNPKEASDYLRTRWGVIRGVGTLSKLRCVGGGPRFISLGHREPKYTEALLDAWVQSRASAPKNSTSEAVRYAP